MNRFCYFYGNPETDSEINMMPIIKELEKKYSHIIKFEYYDIQKDKESLEYKICRINIGRIPLFVFLQEEIYEDINLTTYLLKDLYVNSRTFEFLEEMLLKNFVD